jgi:hypothetical protein
VKTEINSRKLVIDRNTDSGSQLFKLRYFQKWRLQDSVGPVLTNLPLSSHDPPFAGMVITQIGKNTSWLPGLNVRPLIPGDVLGIIALKA